MGGKRVAYPPARSSHGLFCRDDYLPVAPVRPLFVPAKMRSDLRYTMLPTRPWVDKAPNAIEMGM